MDIDESDWEREKRAYYKLGDRLRLALGKLGFFELAFKDKYASGTGAKQRASEGGDPEAIRMLAKLKTSNYKYLL